MTNWTQEQYTDLSKKVAEKFGKPHFDCTSMVAWLFIMELCVAHNVWASHLPPPCSGVDYFIDVSRKGCVKYTDHSNDQSLTERIGRCMALLEVAK